MLLIGLFQVFSVKCQKHGLPADESGGFLGDLTTFACRILIDSLNILRDRLSATTTYVQFSKIALDQLYHKMLT